jgi:hypothetical protein
MLIALVSVLVLELFYFLLQRKLQDKTRPTGSDIGHLHLPFMRLEDIFDQSESQTGPLGLGAVKRIEEALDFIAINTGPGVDN